MKSSRRISIRSRDPRSSSRSAMFQSKTMTKDEDLYVYLGDLSISNQIKSFYRLRKFCHSSFTIVKNVRLSKCFDKGDEKDD